MSAAGGQDFPKSRRDAHNRADVPVLFLFVLIAPEGTWRARFTLEPGRQYSPDEVQVERGACCASSAHTLTVNATHLPAEEDFRAFAARAATRSADDSPDEVRRLLNLLMPF